VSSEHISVFIPQLFALHFYAINKIIIILVKASELRMKLVTKYVRL